MQRITIAVNGSRRVVAARPDTPLLYVLRNHLELHSPKFGCGAGDCGACAVLQDGREIRSCQTPLSAVTGEITTLEGLPRAWAAAQGGHGAGSEGPLHPVQQAWIDEQVPQCGFCQSGMMMAAVDLLGRVPDPSMEDIKQAFSAPHPHLCRCGTYAAIARGVRRAARQMA